MRSEFPAQEGTASEQAQRFPSDGGLPPSLQRTTVTGDYKFCTEKPPTILPLDM